MAMLRILIRFIQISNLVFLAKSKVVDSKTDTPAKITSKKSKAEQAKEDKKAKGNPLNPLMLQSFPFQMFIAINKGEINR